MLDGAVIATADMTLSPADADPAMDSAEGRDTGAKFRLSLLSAALNGPDQTDGSVGFFGRLLKLVLANQRGDQAGGDDLSPTARVSATTPTVDALTTNNQLPTLTGTANPDPGDTLTVTVNGVTYTDGDGKLSLSGTDWTLNIPPADILADGTYEVTATLTDVSLNTISDGSSNELVVDTVAPTGFLTVNSTAATTSTPTLTSAGSIVTEADSILSITVNGITYTNGDGNFSYASTPFGVSQFITSWALTIPPGDALADGIYEVTLTLTDPAGNTTIDTTSNELEVDAVAATPPTVDALTTTVSTPLLTGTASLTGSDVFTVELNGVIYSSANGDFSFEGSNWSLQITPDNALVDDTYEVTATITGAAGSVATDVTSLELVVDSLPTVDSLISNSATPTLTGTASVHILETFSVTVNGVTYTEGVDPDLTLSGLDWTLVIPAGDALGEGTYEVTATVSNGSSQSDVTSNELVVDLTPPAVAPTVNTLTTGDSTPQITGTATAAAGEVLSVTVNGVTYTEGEGQLRLIGTDWTLQIPEADALADGSYDVTATVTDLAGNTTSDATSGELTVSGALPQPPTVNSQTTNDNTPTLNGTAIVGVGQSLSVVVNGVTYTVGDGNLSLAGTDWTLVIPGGDALADGTYDITATVSDGSNSASDGSVAELVIDTGVPAAPTVDSLSTADTTPTLTGTATVAIGETLTVSVDGVTYTDGDGNLRLEEGTWTLTIPDANAINAGTYEVTATVTDDAGNASSDSSSDELVVTGTVIVTPEASLTPVATTDTTPELTGTVALNAGETLVVQVNGVNYAGGGGDLTVSGGDWSLVIPPGDTLATGVYDVSTYVVDGGGIVFSDTTVGGLVVYSAMPAAPTVNSLTTSDTTPTITGTATLIHAESSENDGAVVVTVDEGLQVTVNGITYDGSQGYLTTSQVSQTIITTDPNPSSAPPHYLVLSTDVTWALTLPADAALMDGTYEVSAQVVDGATTIASDSTSNELVIDSAAAAPPTVDSQTSSTATPTLTGTATLGGGDVLTVTVNGVTYTVGDGNLSLVGTDWTLVIPGGDALADGTYDVTATITNGPDSVSDETSGELVVQASVATFDDLLTNDTTPILSGTVPIDYYVNTIGYNLADLSVEVTINGVTYSSGAAEVIVSGDNWTLQIPDPADSLPDDVYDAQVTLLRLGVQTLSSSNGTVTIDTVPPAVPTVNALSTNDNTPAITGTAVLGSGDVLTVTVDGITYTEGDGNLSLIGSVWTLVVPTVLADGSYEVTATVTDGVGNTSSDISSNELFVDATPPAVPTVDALNSNSTTPTLTGTATVGGGEALTVSVNGVTYTVGDGNLSLLGTDWTLVIPGSDALTEGTYEVTATVTDAVSNASSDASSNELVIDTTAPATPTVDSQLTNDTTPTLTGTATVGAGETLTVTVNGIIYTEGDGNLSLGGTDWTLIIPPGDALADGSYEVMATVTDLATNATSDSSSNELEVDATAPAVPTVNALTTTDTTPTLTGTAIVGAGENLSVTVNGVTYTVGDGNLSLAGTDWTLVIPSALAEGTYEVTATVTDTATNASSDASSNELVVDLTPPATPTVNALTTNDTTPTLTGTATVGAGETLTVSVNGATYTAGDGNLSLVGSDWSLTIPTALAEGTYEVTATVTDAAGNASTDVSSNELVIDVTAPATPTVDSQLTNDTTPTLTGTATTTAGEILTVTVNGVTYTDGDGNLSLAGSDWSLTIPPVDALGEGSYEVTATVTDAAGNASTDAGSSELVIDLTAPAVPTVNALTTNDTTPTLTGTATVGAGEILTVTVNGVTYTDGDGNLSLVGSDWTLAIPTALAEGTYEVTVTVTDTATNASSDASSNELVVDITPPAAPTVNSLTTNDTTPTLTGTATVGAGEALTVTVNGVNYTDGDGNLSLVGSDWSLTIPTALAEGTYEVTATVTDAAGNAGVDVSSNELVIDVTAPATPTVDSQLTNDTTPTLTGTATTTAGEILTVTVNGVTYTDGDGNLSLAGSDWTLTIPPADALGEGSYEVTATVTDAAGNASFDTSSNELVIDLTAPAVPTVNALTTNDVTPTLTGTATLAVDEMLTVTVNGVTYTEGDGNLSRAGSDWSLTIPTADALGDGTYEVTATVTDAAGNASPDAGSNELVIDLTAPLTPTVDPLNTNDTTPTLTGTATLAAGETLTVTVNGVTYTAGDGNLSLVGSDWNLAIPTALAEGTYEVTATVTDLATNASSDATSNELVIDLTTPATPTVDSQLSNDPTPTVTGTAVVGAGETLTVTVNGVTYTAGDGNLSLTGSDWSLTIPPADALVEGSYEVTATVTDAAGNTSFDASSSELVIDLTAPAVPTVNALTTNDATPTLTGTATLAVDEMLTVTVNGVTYTDGDGNLDLVGSDWSLTIPTALAGGSYDVVASVTDTAGNSSVDASSGELSIIASPPLVGGTPPPPPAGGGPGIIPPLPPGSLGGDVQPFVYPGLGFTQFDTTVWDSVLIEQRQLGDSGVQEFTLPDDFFVHQDPAQDFSLSASLADGSSLPSYVSFDPATGTFRIDADAAIAAGENVIEIRIIATDADGNQAASVIRIILGEGEAPPAAQVEPAVVAPAKASLAEQIGSAGQFGLQQRQAGLASDLQALFGRPAA